MGERERDTKVSASGSWRAAAPLLRRRAAAPPPHLRNVPTRSACHLSHHLVPRSLLSLPNRKGHASRKCANKPPLYKHLHCRGALRLRTQNLTGASARYLCHSLSACASRDTYACLVSPKKK